jgi:hypothetical protein
MMARLVSVTRPLATGLVFAALAFGVSSAALAQRDPAYAAARE